MSRHAARARTGQDRTGLYQEITDKIIAVLEAGRVPWVQPWGTAAAKAPPSCELACNNDPLRGVFRVQSRPL
jgi:antirestriction protein ArdC